MSEDIEIEADEAELLPVPVDIPQMNLFGSDDPFVVVERATRTANALMEVVRQKGLVTHIQGRDHPRVEAWTLLGSMLGVFPQVEWSRPIERDGVRGYEARAIATTLAGATVGAAEAECLASEVNWRGKPDFAIRSMAQTRAISKALAGPLRFIMVLAGFEGTPAEEMDNVKTNRQPVKSVVDPVPTFARDDLLDELTDFFDRTKADPPQGWTPQEVVETANRLWGSPTLKIEVLGDMDGEMLDAIKRAAINAGVW